MGAGRVVDLDAPGLAWADVAMPASSAPVRLVRLHADEATGSSVSLVRFPPAWTRPGTGHYTCAEEFAVLDGRISVSGVDHPAGTHAYLPGLATRAASAAGAGGCLAVAWFSGPPRWRDGVADGAPAPGRAGRGGRSVLLGSLAELPGRPAGAGGLDMTFLDARAWAYVPSGGPLPELPGRVLVRRWGRGDR
ncbi:cupin domain-containing protein [Actinocorallia populi]|uniref:hypothetical protein n=1 Tax=Actinocorallia populi TaxID=2079200 RepID=UPI001300B1D5|nr:hypothetical protein [Actinocorallia populi]